MLGIEPDLHARKLINFQWSKKELKVFVCLQFLCVFLFLIGTTSGGAQDLLLELCSGITPGGCSSRSAMSKANALPIVLWPRP